MYPLHTPTVKDQEAAKGTNEVTNGAHFTRKESTACHTWLTLTPKVPIYQCLLHLGGTEASLWLWG